MTSINTSDLFNPHPFYLINVKKRQTSHHLVWRLVAYMLSQIQLYYNGETVTIQR